jgi:hypothetical protein
MSRKVEIRWIYGVSAAGFLGSGLIQFFQGNAHAWILIAGAALILTGLILVARKLHWGGLVALWGLMTGAVWFLGLLGSNDSFPLGAWITGVGMATIAFFQDRGKTSTKPQSENHQYGPSDGA